MISITGWGMFWAGLFGFLAFCTLAEIIETGLKCHAITKSVKHLSKIDPETIKKAVGALVED